MRQKIQLELAFSSKPEGEARRQDAAGTEAHAADAGIDIRAVMGPSMERIVEQDNLKKALAQVRRNKGAPGADGMTVDNLAAHLKEHWPTIKAQLLDGTYSLKSTSRATRLVPDHSSESRWSSNSQCLRDGIVIGLTVKFFGCCGGVVGRIQKPEPARGRGKDFS